MGQAFRKLFDAFFGTSEMRVVMLGLDAAGKTTILYKLHIGEVLSTVPTIGFNVEKVQYKNVMFTVWDVGGQEKLRPLWRHYFNNTDGLIYVVDSLDRERIGKAKAEFQAIVNDPLMLNSVILVFANKQDMVEKEIGEQRVISFHGVGLSVAEEIKYGDVTTHTKNPDEDGYQLAVELEKAWQESVKFGTPMDIPILFPPCGELTK